MNDTQSHAKPTRSRAKPTEPKPAKPHYLSLNEQEFERLRQLGFRERWAYMELKKLCNWKTGTCGEFASQRLSYAQIAKLVTAPGVQGRGMGDIDDKQAADFLQRMEAVGLVANIGRRTNSGLRFDMPLAPIQQRVGSQSGEMAAPPSGEVQDFSPDAVESPEPASSTSTRVCEGSASSLSVMINKEINISIDGADSAVAEAAPCRAAGAAPIRENPPAPQPAAAGSPAPRLTAREIQEAIQDNWMFTETSTAQALAHYQTWADAGLTLDALHAAMTSLEEDASCPALTPESLHEKLWPSVVDAWSRQMAA